MKKILVLLFAIALFQFTFSKTAKSQDTAVPNLGACINLSVETGESPAMARLTCARYENEDVPQNWIGCVEASLAGGEGLAIARLNCSRYENVPLAWAQCIKGSVAGGENAASARLNCSRI